MKKLIFLIALICLFSSAFAVTSNSIQHFSLSYGDCPSIPFLGSNQKCLLISSTCTAQAIATLKLSNGMSKDIICSSWDVGASWSLGDLGSTSQLTGVLTIPAPCIGNSESGASCSKSATIFLDDSKATEGISPTWVFVGIIIVVVLIFGWVFMVIHPYK